MIGEVIAVWSAVGGLSLLVARVAWRQNEIARAAVFLGFVMLAVIVLWLAGTGRIK